MKTAGIVLCGGRSSRMGEDKASLRFRDGDRAWTLQSWMADRWAGHCDPLVWVGFRGEAQGGASERWIEDEAAYVGQGPVAGLYSGLRALVAEKDYPKWALLLAVDMPEFDPAWVELLSAETKEEGEALGFAPPGGRTSLFGALIPVQRGMQVAKELLDEGELRLTKLQERLGLRTIAAPAGIHSRALRSGLNHREDFEAWLARCGYGAVTA